MEGAKGVHTPHCTSLSVRGGGMGGSATDKGAAAGLPNPLAHPHIDEIMILSTPQACTEQTHLWKSCTKVLAMLTCV